ncbi:GNAT family N-acetyltransferase [Nonomuraea sp. NPDC026600]|uniref:GNAT family N-acetyltransferase n=1 Tax=Nonomuraea sp. NPDC026600 TaxID=3155363 RepID=UPI00340A6994
MTSVEAAAAREAAEKTGVTIRELREVHEFEDVYRLYDDIWHPDPRNAPVPVELMIAFAHAGGYVAGAYEGDRLVGASVGFRAADRTLHSHVTGAAIGRGIGYALKLHQRAWCLERGLVRVTWTFDPLVRRNARFNLVKLGARPERYLEDFYGVMADAINEGDASDRLLAVWRLTEPPPEAAAGPYTWGVDVDGARPVVGRTDGVVVLVETPYDIETLRREDPEAARAWRLVVREVLGGLMGSGARVTGFTEDGEYVLEKS